MMHLHLALLLTFKMGEMILGRLGSGYGYNITCKTWLVTVLSDHFASCDWVPVHNHVDQFVLRVDHFQE